jgi:hypothetical protein
MSDNVETENSFADLVDAALAKDYNKANEIFGAAIAAKQNDVLDQERIKVAGQIFNGVEDEEEVEDSEDLANGNGDQEDTDLDDDSEDTEEDNSSEVEK